MGHSLTASTLVLVAVLHGSVLAGSVPFAAFAGDTMESFEGIAGPLAFPNFGVTGIRGPCGAAYVTPTGLVLQNVADTYICDWAFGQANICSTGVCINGPGDVIDGTAYFFTYNSIGRVMIDLPWPCTRWGVHMGGNGVQNTTFDMYLGGILVDSFTTTGLTDFNNFTGWQSIAMFDHIEWDGGHAGFDLFSFDGSAAPPPTCTLTGPVAPTDGDVSVFLDASSMSAPSVDATFEYSLDGGVTFAPATAAAGSPLANPATGVPTGLATFVWDTVADGVAALAAETDVSVRATIDDLVGPPGECTTMSFEVDNSRLCGGICGDCDLSAANPDVLDALASAQIAAGLLTPTTEQMGCCDVDSSGSITVLDALGIAQSAAGLPGTLVCP